ncbi:glutathione synthase [Spirulina sp. CS-785/01]|uniref:glutathione synthase n=1 Tax=Spirulina sp. CS-785/01 TaxID=3021716 RepID=UPI00232D3394|nr:glutathione synthase [Spirulina sp. CS-785/01]MDB9314743.1 glutathione synthase [Spirulina sp. CS-785/01]
MKFAFIIDPIAQLNPVHDSSVAMMEAAQAAGHEVWITEFHQLTVKNGQVWGFLLPVTLTPVELAGDHWVAVEDWYKMGEGSLQPLSNMDAVLMRKDPPVTIPYLYTTQILDLIPDSTLVVNAPRGLQAANEKLYALNFPSVIPETIVTQDKAVILDFVAQREAAILKPLAGKGGEGILFLEERDRNLNSLLEISTRDADTPLMLQEYLPAASQGDKRIILLDGKPIGALNRIPTGKEFRGNMAVGGRVAQTEITPRDQEICATVAPQLKADGLYFVGLDLIGDYLTEVNVTSPTGIREIDLLSQVSLGKTVIDWIAQQVS